MLKERQINEIVLEAARATLSSESVVDARSEPAVDSGGDAALSITVVLKPESTKSITGDAVMETYFEIQQRLRQAGEERFPIITYATKAELTDVAD